MTRPSRRSKPRREQHWCVVERIEEEGMDVFLAVCCETGESILTEDSRTMDEIAGRVGDFSTCGAERVAQYLNAYGNEGGCKGHAHMIVGHDGDPFAGGDL